MDEALQAANNIALRNAEKNEAVYQEDLSSWTEKRDAAELIWQKAMEQYRRDYDAWKKSCEDAMKKWNLDKAKYAQDKKRIEEEIRMWAEKEQGIHGFGAELKRRKANDTILQLTIQLKNLVIPEKAVIPEEPALPDQPVLRRKPVLTFEDKVGKREVREAFFTKWNQ